MANGWLGLDADTWGNVITAATGAGAILGGALTVSRTAQLSRHAKAEERKADREIELRAQSRDAFVRAFAATNRYEEIARERKRRGASGHEADLEESAELSRLVRRMTESAILVQEDEPRRGLLTVAEIYSLVPSGYRSAEDNREAIEAEQRTVIALAGDVAAAFLREDVGAQGRLMDRVRTAYATAKRQSDKALGAGT